MALDDLILTATIDGADYQLTYDADGRYTAQVPAPLHSSFNSYQHVFDIVLRASGPDVDIPGIMHLKLQVKEVTQPEITPIYPVDGQRIITATPTISWRIHDADSGLDMSTIKAVVNVSPASNIQVDGEVCSFIPARLSAGACYLRYSVTDNDGNVATKQIIFTVDTPAPQITITAPEDGILINTSVLQVTGKVTASAGMYLPLSGYVMVDAINQGALAISENGSFSKIVKLSQGLNTIMVVVNDASGATAHAIRQVTVDRIAPTFISIDMTLNEDKKTCTLVVNVVDT